MAKIVRAPQLRYTQDNQLAVTDMMVEFENSAPNSPPCTLKAVAWGNLATDINQQYNEGNEVILTGRLKMNLIDRQEGFKEKIAELTISHIYPLEVGTINSRNSSSNSSDKIQDDYSSEEDNGDLDLDDDPIPF
jgi:single-stranded DNA-binding protein